MQEIENSQERLVFEEGTGRQLWIAMVATIVFAALSLWFFFQGNDAGVVFAVFAVSGPVYVFFFVESRSIAFDKGAGQVTFSRRGLRGTESKAYSLTDVARVELHRATADAAARTVPLDATPLTGVPVRPVLVASDGRVIPLIEEYAPGSTGFDMVRRIRAWLAG